MHFVDKICVVTGGGSGIGLATCKRFAAEGGKVVVVDINEEYGTQAVQTINAAGGQAIFAKADISISADVRRVVNTVVDTWGRIDVLVNNAAIMTFIPIIDLPEDEWDKLMAVNLKAVFLLCKHCLPYMDQGAIVNVSSVHAHQTTVNIVPYAASKGGLEAFTRGLSRECKNVRVNNIAPGAVNTPMLWSNPNVKSGQERIEGEIAQPEAIAAVISFLASDEASFINGTTLVVDGGRLAML